MGMATNKQAQQGRSSRRRRRKSSMSEINVTPFVDVMLVLLIIFMVAAPLMTVGVAVELPKTGAKQLDTPQQPIIITVTPTSDIYIGDDNVSLRDLSGVLIATAEGDISRKLYIRGDKATSYGDIMQVMSRAQNAGFTSIGMVSDKDEN